MSQTKGATNPVGRVRHKGDGAKGRQGSASKGRKPAKKVLMAPEAADLGSDTKRRTMVKGPDIRHVYRAGAIPKESSNGLLKNIALFSSLTDKELHEIRTHIVLREFKKNQMILHEEDTSEFMYVIVHGKVKISRAGKEGKEMVLSMHGSGEFFGEMSLIDGKTVPASVSAVEDSLVAIISKDHFYSLLYSQQKVLENLLKIFCSRLRESWQRIQMLNFNDAAQRIKMLFLMLAENYGEKTADGTTLHIKLIHQDIADMTGLTRETVTRVLDKWKRGGEIAISKNKHIHLYPDFESIQL
jgi:CRP/FNR family transcriptional regulator